MDGNQFENLTLEQKLRLTVHRDVRAICREAAHFQGLEVDIPAMELIAELAWKKLQVYATDLELFAKYVKHAKRATINADDLKLLVRRNPSLKARISSLADAQSSSSVKDNKKKKSAAAVPDSSRASTSTIATTSANTATAISEDDDINADDAFIDLT